MGVFTYSDVDTAQSFALREKVAEEVKTERRDRLMALQRKISARKLKSRVGTIETALLEGESRESELVWEARLQGMAADIDGKVYVNDVASVESQSLQAQVSGAHIPQPGDLVRIEITESHDYDLVGKILDVVRPAAKRDAIAAAAVAMPPHVPVQRIATGAPLRVLQ
jgi:ribosomal protein S12 methylthiotransferase